MLAMSTNNPHATTTQPSWLEDLMAHVQPHRMPELSVSASGENASAFWKSGSIVTDPFAPPSDPIQVLPTPSPLNEFQTPPSSKFSTGHSPDAQTSVLDAVDDTLAASHTPYGGPALTGEYLAEVTVINGCKGPGGEVVVRGQASCTAATHQSRKRKPDQVVSDDTSDKENMSSTRPAPAAKRICREKTGTEWQTVFDVVKFGEDQQSKENDVGKMTACGRSQEVL